MTVVGRSQVDHPAFGTIGGSALHAAVETIYTNLSNDLAGRFRSASSVANSTLTTVTHNFGVALSELTILLYTGTFPNLARVADPSASGWTIAATGSNPKTQLDVTTPASGGPHTFAVFIVHGRGNEKISQLSDVNFSTAPVDGQLLTYVSGTGKWTPSFLVYPSEAASLASNTLTPATGASLQRITSGTGPLHMIAGPAAGKILVLVNESGADITVKHDTGATAASRIYTGTGTDIVLKNQACVSVIYSSGLSRWIVTGGAAGSDVIQPIRGGFGTDGSGWTGFVKAASGVYSAAPLAAADLPTEVAFETGSATVAFASATGSVTISASARTISWVRIGNLVFIAGRLDVSSVSSPTGYLRVTGLPYSAAVDCAIKLATVVGRSFESLTQNIYGKVLAGTNYITIEDFQDGDAANGSSFFSLGSPAIIVGGFYIKS